MKNKVTVVYDKACPICHSYCALAQKVHPNEISLIDARQKSELGDDTLYYGSRAIHVLANQGGDTLFDRINKLFFKRLRVAERMYPLLKSVRNLLLKMLGIQKINNLRRANNQRF